jgi:hypothetical protein
MRCLRIAIAGSRSITNYDHLLSAIDAAVKSNVITPAHSYEIVTGGARGVDSLARRYAQERQLKLTELKPQYQYFGDRGAPLRRNYDIAEASDVLLAIWDGQSPGTGHMIECMKQAGKPYYVHYVK